jgi:hypothetical protein
MIIGFGGLIMGRFGVLATGAKWDGMFVAIWTIVNFPYFPNLIDNL